MVNARMKYVVFYSRSDGEQIIIFPKAIQHSVMAGDVYKSSFGCMSPISGGFIVDGECVGESVSLRMKSRGDADTALIPVMLDICSNETSTAASEAKLKPVISKNKAKRLRRKK